MGNILGLDIGTNSIGWAVVQAESVVQSDNHTIEKPQSIVCAGSRILPFDEAQLQDFSRGVSVSLTKNRREKRSMRRLFERPVLRRQRLLRVLGIMGFLPPHFARTLDRYGAPLVKGDETKLAWEQLPDKSYHFLFAEAFNEMLARFASENPAFLEQNRRVPHDWTLYYLRTKALTKPLSSYELAWVLLSFNQKRGYYQLRSEAKADPTKKEEIATLRVLNIVPEETKRKGKKASYMIELEGGYTYHYSAYKKPDWEGKSYDFIITTRLDESGKPKLKKDGSIDKSIRMPAANDWTLCKLKTENDISSSRHKTVGTYIFNSLLRQPEQKVRGELVHTVDRRFYRDELHAILKKQMEYHPALSDEKLYKNCVCALYPSNEARRSYLLSRPDFLNLFESDLIFYQRPLKSQKALVADCPFESHCYIERKAEGTEHHSKTPVKCAARSNPYFIEFRLWQFVSHLRISRIETLSSSREEEVRNLIDTVERRVEIFDFLNSRENVNQDQLLSFLFKKEKKYYRWNYPDGYVHPLAMSFGRMCCVPPRSAMLEKTNCSRSSTKENSPSLLPKRAVRTTSFGICSTPSAMSKNCVGP